MKKEFLTDLSPLIMLWNMLCDTECDDRCKNCTETDCSLCCDYEDDMTDDECDDNGESVKTIAEQLKAVCTTNDPKKELNDALEHVKTAIADAIVGDFENDAKYAELIPNKGIRFINDPIICSIIASDKRYEFRDRIVNEFGFKTVLIYFDQYNDKKSSYVDLIY